MTAESSNVVLVSDAGKSARDAALELRDQIRAKLEEIAPLMDKINALGMCVEFNMGRDTFGRSAVIRLAIFKPASEVT